MNATEEKATVDMASINISNYLYQRKNQHLYITNTT